MKTENFWIVTRPSGRPLEWSSAFRSRADAIKEAIPGCMGSPEYEDLGGDSARWRYLYRRGYRVIRICATKEAP